MTNSSDLLLDFVPLSDATLTLLPEYYQQAVQLSRHISHPQRQWQTYLNVLALLSFEQWLARREPKLSLNREQCNINETEAVSRLLVGEFKICLLVRGTLDDEVITLPRTVVNLPQEIAQFYVAIAVDEEGGHAQIEGVLRYDRLQSLNLQPQSDRTYEIPLIYFDPDPEHLLLYLRCLDPTAIALPSTATPIKQRVINANLWLQNQVDEIARMLSWQLLPSPLLATSSLRSSEEFERILAQIRQMGLEISPQASGIYQNLNFASYPLQLYAITESIPTQSEWSLLIILGTQSSNILPEGLKLQIRDRESILVEQIAGRQNYLYARVIGNLDEQFTVTLLLEDREILTLPPFVFQ